jgi:hypothetical protein
MCLTLVNCAWQPTAHCMDAHTEQVSSFSAGNFARSAALGEQLATQEPKNAKARYYYAQALLKLGRSTEALTQFSQCYANTTDPTLRTYCQTAIQTLSAQANIPSQNENKVDTQSKHDNAMNSLKTRVMEDALREIKFLRKRADEDIQVVKTRLSEQINGIPQFTYTAYSRGGGQTKWPNPFYKETLDRIDAEIAVETAKINEAFTKRETEITATCKRRTEDYDRVSTGMQSQLKQGTSLMQMTPQHSSVYSRQYVNYDGSSETPLKARAAALAKDKQLVKDAGGKAVKTTPQTLLK